MGSFNDFTCEICKKRFGTAGKVQDETTCPHCGYAHDTSAMQAAIDAAIAKLDEEDSCETESM